MTCKQTTAKPSTDLLQLKFSPDLSAFPQPLWIRCCTMFPRHVVTLVITWSVIIPVAIGQRDVWNAQGAIFTHQLRLTRHSGSGRRSLHSVVRDNLTVGRTWLQEGISWVRVLQVAPDCRQLRWNLKVFVRLSTTHNNDAILHYWVI